MSFSGEETERMDSPLYQASTTPRRPQNRRRSVADEASLTQQYIQQNIETLTRLWDEVHMNEESRVSRLHVAHEHIRTLVDDMVDAETKMVESVKDGIIRGQKNIQNMRKQLKLDQWICRHPFPSIALWREVEREEKWLKEQYDARISEQEKIIERLDIIATRIGRNVVEYLPDPKTLLSSSELDVLRNTVAEFETELKERVTKALKLQRDLRVWSRNLGQVYGNNDDPALKVFLEEDMEDENFVLSPMVMDKIEQFWSELSGMHDSWVQEMDMDWVERYEELKELWDSCHISEQERIYSAHFDPIRHTRDDICKMITEISKLKAIFAAREPVYKLLAEWKENWKLKLEMEEKKKDPSYYQSRERGHNLMKDAAQERNINEVRLPSLKRQIETAYNEFKNSHPSERILIEGNEPTDYIKWIEDEHKLSKERERAAKKKQNISDVRTTPTSLKSKIGMRTPAHPSHIPQKLSRGEPQYSIITPTRTQEHGPKTSSPKDTRQPTLSTPKRVMSPLKKRN